MSLNIIGFIKSLLPNFSKSDLESDMEQSIESIPDILNIYSSLESVIKGIKLESKESKDILKTFYKEIDSVKHKNKISSTKNIGTDTLTFFKNVKENGDYLLNEISDSVNDVIVSQALTAYKANLLRSVSHYFFLTRYSLDLANYLYIKEAEHGKMDLDKNYKLVKKQEEFITKNIWLYTRALAVYGTDPSEFKHRLEKISEVSLPKEAIDEVVDLYNSDKIDITNVLPNNFIGSPIYSVRLIFAEWQSQRFHSSKDKRKLLELRLLHLKLMKEQGQSDIAIEKEIVYLQKQVTNIDKYLSDLESDVEK